jgi:hypothetical protein
MSSIFLKSVLKSLISDLNKKDRNKCHSSPFINVVNGVFFVVRVTLVPVSFLSAPSAVHSYGVPGKSIRRLKSLFPFCLNLTSFPTFLTLQDKHNIRTLSLNIKFICTRCETGLKSSPKARYSACFKFMIKNVKGYKKYSYSISLRMLKDITCLLLCYI